MIRLLFVYFNLFNKYKLKYKLYFKNYVLNTSPNRDYKVNMNVYRKYLLVPYSQYSLMVRV